MRKRRRIKRRNRFDVRVWILVGLVGFGLVGGWFWEAKTAKLSFEGLRSNILFINEDGGAAVMSLDGVTKKISWLFFPGESLIASRSFGYYRVDKLVKLARYEKDFGGFLTGKFQNLVKLPFQAYCLEEDKVDLSGEVGYQWWWRCKRTNLNLVDKLRLSYWFQKDVNQEFRLKDWRRLGVLGKETEEGRVYKDDPLNEFIKNKLFDWKVAQEGLTAAVIDESGHDLSHDLGDLLENIGFKVVMTRNGRNSRKTEAEIWFGDEKLKRSLGAKALMGLFRQAKIEVKNTDDYRADVVIWLGKKANENLF